MISDDACLTKVYDKVCTAIQVGQNNSVLLARIITRLEMLVHRISYPGNAAADTSACSTSSADTTGQFSDVSTGSEQADLPNLAKMIPCNSNDEIDLLEKAMANSSNREWMVRNSCIHSTRKMSLISLAPSMHNTTAHLHVNCTQDSIIITKTLYAIADKTRKRGRADALRGNHRAGD